MAYKIGIIGAPGSGKCLAKGTKVIMYDFKLKSVEDIQIGDELMGVDGSKRTVQELSSGFADLYDVIQVNGITYRVTGNHILTLTMSGKQYENKSKIIKITVNDWLQQSNQFKKRAKGFVCDCLHFDAKDLPLDPYYLGLWLGDGCSNNLCRITTADKEIINYLKDFAKIHLIQNFEKLAIQNIYILYQEHLIINVINYQKYLKI